MKLILLVTVALILNVAQAQPVDTDGELILDSGDHIFLNADEDNLLALSGVAKFEALSEESRPEDIAFDREEQSLNADPEKVAALKKSTTKVEAKATHPSKDVKKK